MLTMSEVVALMKELKPRFFEGLTPSEVASIVSPATKRRFPAHSVMAHEGHPADRLFLMIHNLVSRHWVRRVARCLLGRNLAVDKRRHDRDGGCVAWKPRCLRSNCCLHFSFESDGCVRVGRQRIRRIPLAPRWRRVDSGFIVASRREYRAGLVRLVCQGCA